MMFVRLYSEEQYKEYMKAVKTHLSGAEDLALVDTEPEGGALNFGIRQYMIAAGDRPKFCVNRKWW